MKKDEFLRYVKGCLVDALVKSVDALNGHRLDSIVESIPHNGVRITLTYPYGTPQGIKYVEASEPLSIYAIEGPDNIWRKVQQLCNG